MNCTSENAEMDKETGVIKERRGVGSIDRETEREDVRMEPKPACDGNLMRRNRVPTGQLTSATASLTKPPGPFMPRPDANKENQGKHTQTHVQTDFVLMTTPRKTEKLQDELQNRAEDKTVT